MVPLVGSVVTGKVVAITPRFAKVSLTTVGTKVPSGSFIGVIRKADIRLNDIDNVEMYKCYRPGDVIRAKILSLGDARSYYLTTAGVEFGVIWAKSDAGVPMIPFAWNLMKCPHTNTTVHRKVAKVT